MSPLPDGHPTIGCSREISALRVIGRVTNVEVRRILGCYNVFAAAAVVVNAARVLIRYFHILPATLYPRHIFRSHTESVGDGAVGGAVAGVAACCNHNSTDRNFSRDTRTVKADPLVCRPVRQL